jgi:hypothetical protein
MKDLDIWGKLVMERLRDEAISFGDGMQRGHWKAPGLKNLQKDLKKFGKAEAGIVRRAIRASIDSGIHAFLFALQEAGDQGKVEIRINGKSITELSDGLHGELFTPKGWQARFSEFGEAPEEA